MNKGPLKGNLMGLFNCVDFLPWVAHFVPQDLLLGYPGLLLQHLWRLYSVPFHHENSTKIKYDKITSTFI